MVQRRTNKRRIIMAYSLSNTLSRINMLGERERITKNEIKELSRDVLLMLHDTESNPHVGDISACNAFLSALSPANKRTAWIYLKHFTGFAPILDEDGEESSIMQFGGKDRKAKYEAARDAALEYVRGGGHLWIWAEKHVEIKKTPFNLGKFQEMLASAFKKAEKNGISKADQLAAILANGITEDDLLAAMEAMTEAKSLLRTEKDVTPQPEMLDAPDGVMDNTATV